MDNNPFSVLNVDRRPSNKWNDVRRFCFGSLTRTTLTGAVLLWLFLNFTSGGQQSRNNGSTGSERTTIGSFPAVVIHRDFEVLPDGSQKAASRSYSLEVQRPYEAIPFFAGLLLFSFMFALTLSPFWSRWAERE